MPFTRADVERHIKGLGPTQEAAWVKIANNALSRCLAQGGGDVCEGRAIRIANATAKRVGESYELLTDDELLKAFVKVEEKKLGDLKKEPDMSTTDIIEHFERGDALREAHIDRESNLISNVKLCGKLSKNGRTYTDKALEDAARLYAGAPFYLDHPRDSELRDRRGVRSVLDLAGKVVNPRKVGDSVRGDLHLLDREPTKTLVFALAEQMPDMAGNSHRAKGTVRRENGHEIVESLDEVFGVELVTDPATASGLYESINNEGTDMKDVTLVKLKDERPDLIEAILKDAKSGDQAKTITEERDRLKKENDEFKAKQAETERQKLIETKLAEAKLPKTVITDVFKEQLQSAEDEATIDKLIEDRKTLAKHVRSSGPVSTEREIKEGEGGEFKPVDEAALGDIHANLFN